MKIVISSLKSKSRCTHVTLTCLIMLLVVNKHLYLSGLWLGVDLRMDTHKGSGYGFANMELIVFKKITDHYRGI